MQGHFIDDAEFADMGLQQGYFRRIAGTHECKGKQTKQETNTEEPAPEVVPETEPEVAPEAEPEAE